VQVYCVQVYRVQVYCVQVYCVKVTVCKCIVIMYIWHAKLVHSSFPTIIYSVIQIMKFLCAIFPNPAYVLRFRSTYSPKNSQFVFPGYAFFERRVSTRDPGVSFCRTCISSSVYYSTSCYKYLDYVISIDRVHISRSLIAISAIVTKRLDRSE